MLSLHNDIPSKMISIEKLPPESFLKELNPGKKRWLINSTYSPNNGNIESQLESVSKGLGIYLNKSENVILLGGLNTNRFFYKKISLRIMI